MNWIEALLSLTHIGEEMYKRIEGTEPTDATLKKAKLSLKDHFKHSANTDVVSIRTQWEKIKAKADISTNAAYKELIDFMDDVHAKAEKELDAKKNAWVVWLKSWAGVIDYKDVSKQYTSEFEDVKKSLAKFHSLLIDTMLKLLREEIAKVKEKESKDTSKLDTNHEIKFAEVCIALKQIQDRIKQYIGNKYVQALGSSSDQNVESIIKDLPICASYLRILMSFAGISSGEEKGSTIFGKGFLAKATGNALVPPAA